MTTTDAWLDVEALRKLAGDKVFAEAQRYHHDDKVTLFAVTADRIVAHVMGSRYYRVLLDRHGTSFRGACSCSKGGETRPCRHKVASLLAGNDADRTMPASQPADRIHFSFAGASVSAFARAVSATVGDVSKPTSAAVDLTADLTDAQKQRFEELRRAADESWAPKEEYLGVRDLREWTDRLHQELDRSIAISSSGQPELALCLLDHLLDLVASFLATNGDRGSYGRRLMERAYDLHLEAARAVHPNSAALAQALFRLESRYGEIFRRAAHRYADVLGDEGLEEYRTRAVAEWNRLVPARTAGNVDFQYQHDHDRLLPILDFFAERAGDKAARIALRTKILSHTSHYLELANFCLR